jgi:TolB-like protein
MSLFNELKRRNVFRVGIAYAVAAWLLLQLTDVLIQLLELDAGLGRYVVITLAVGFIPAVFFAWAFEITPEGLKKERDVDRAQSITPQTGRRLDRAIIAMLVLALSYFIWESRFAVREESGPSSKGETAVAAVGGRKSIAVLPFVNMSDDADNEYFSDGISEEILNALATVRELDVAGRTSSFAFKGQNLDLREIARILGVSHVLEGSVRREGDTVRITAQLIQAEDGFHLWSETYDRELTSVFAIQDEIAGAILGQLTARLLAEGAGAPVSTRTDPEAYELYLRARQRIDERNRPSLELALGTLDQALEIDPAYAPAHAQRGIATLLLIEGLYGDLPRKQTEPLARDFIDTSLELNATLAEGWAALGLYHIDRPREHLEAIDALQKALSFNPNMLNASNWLQLAYQMAGQPEKKLPILENIVERDPLFRPGVANAVDEFNIRGMQERSFTLLERIRTLTPDDPWLANYEARTLISLGQYARAQTILDEAILKLPDDGVLRFHLGTSLWNTHQYERMLESGLSKAQQVIALRALGRAEEALMLAFEVAAEGNVLPLLETLHRLGRHEQLLRFVEERWVDLDTFEAAEPGGSRGYGEMIYLAFAYLNTGNIERFTDAMGRISQVHENLLSHGYKSGLLYWFEANYHAMNGDEEKALDSLQLAIDHGAIGHTRLVRSGPPLTPLESDPRFQEIQAQMIRNLNAQRAMLGLQPLS